MEPIERSEIKRTVSVNISVGGICLIVYEKIEVGSIVALKIHLADTHSFIEAKGRVVWRSHFTLSSDNRDRYDLGIEFIEIKEPDRQMISKYVFKYLKV